MSAPRSCVASTGALLDLAFSLLFVFVTLSRITGFLRGSPTPHLHPVSPRSMPLSQHYSAFMSPSVPLPWQEGSPLTWAHPTVRTGCAILITVMEKKNLGTRKKSFGITRTSSGHSSHCWGSIARLATDTGSLSQPLLEGPVWPATPLLLPCLKLVLMYSGNMS